MAEVKALSLTQPWAEAVAALIKEWETRSWSTNYRGPLVIHAAKGFPAYAREFADVEHTIGRMPARVPLGAIVAVTTLTDVRPTVEVALEVSALERLYGDYSPGRFAWRLEGTRRLAEPIPCKGALGLWTPPPDVLETLRAAIKDGEAAGE